MAVVKVKIPEIDIGDPAQKEPGFLDRTRDFITKAKQAVIGVPDPVNLLTPEAQRRAQDPRSPSSQRIRRQDIQNIRRDRERGIPEVQVPELDFANKAAEFFESAGIGAKTLVTGLARKETREETSRAFREGFDVGLLSTASALEATGSVVLDKIGFDQLSDRLDALRARDQEYIRQLNSVGIEVEDHEKFSDAVRDPNFVARGLAQNLPNMLLSLGAGIATGGLGGGAVGATLAVGATSMTLEGGFAYNDALNFGATEEEAEKAMLLTGVANGILETIPITRLINRSEHGKAIKRQILRNVVRSIVQQSLEEAGTESLQEIVSNAVARTYDENRELFSGIEEAAFFGGLMGGLAGGVTDIAVSQPPIGLTIREVTDEIPKELEPLLQEARKYKSAEEFVEKSGTRVFHGTSKEAARTINEQGFTFGKSKGMRGTPVEGVAFVTPKKTSAKFFAENNLRFKDGYIIEGRVFGEFLDVGVANDFEAMSKALGVLLKRGSITRDEIPIIGTSRIDIPQIKKALDKGGFSGIKFKDAQAGNRETLAVFDENALKTKSQLTSLWEQAQKGAGRRPPFDRRIGGIEPAPFIRRQETTLLKERIRNIARGFREGRRFTKQEIRDVQNQLIGVIEESTLPREDRGKFSRAIKNVQTPEQLDFVLPEIEARINRLTEASNVRTLRAQVTRELKATKIRKQAGKPKGRFTADIQSVLDKIREFSKLTKDEADLRIQMNLQTYKDQIPPDSIALENRLLQLAGGIKDKNSIELNNLLQTVRALKDQGRMTAELKGFNREVTVDGWVNRAIRVITGGKGIDTGIKTTGVKDRDRSMRAFFRRIGSSQVGWNDLVDMISSLDRESRAGESWLNSFSNVREQVNNESRGIRMQSDQLKEMAARSFDVDSDRQLIRRFYEDSIEESLGIFKNADGVDVEILMSKAEARKRWMELQDPTLQETFTEGMKYTTEIREAIENFLSPQDKAFAQEQLSFYQNYYKTVNATYRDIYGVDLPPNPKYSPIRRTDIAREDLSGFGEMMQEIQVRRSIGGGSLKSRVANIKPLRQVSDISTLQQHILEMEHFKGWVNKVKDLRSVFGNTDVRNAIEQYHGREVLAAVDDFLERFTGGGREKAGHINFVDRMRIRFARAVLAIKPAIAVKQMVSFPAYAENVPIGSFVAGLIDFAKSPIKNTRFLRERSDLMQARGRNFERDIKAAVETDEFSLFAKSPSFMNSLMLNIRIGDQGAIAFGGWAAYRWKKNELLRQGKSPADAEKGAIEFFEEVTRRTQQSGDLDQLSTFQTGGSLAKIFSLFKSAPNQYFRRELSAFRNLVSGRTTTTQFLKTFTIYHFILPMLFQFIADLGWDKDNQKRAAILGSFNGIFILGEGLEYLANVVAGATAFDPQNPIITPITREFSKAARALREDEIGWEEVMKAVDGIASGVGQLTGFPVETTFDIGEGILDIVHGEEMGLFKILGWSPWTIERASKRQSSGGIRIPQIKIPEIETPGVEIPSISI